MTPCNVVMIPTFQTSMLYPSSLHPEDGDSMVLWNVGILQRYTASQPRRRRNETSRPWKPQNSHWAVFCFLESKEHSCVRKMVNSEWKVKLSLCFFYNITPRHEGVLGEWRYSSTHSLISALDGGEWSASRPSRFTPRERAPGTHWIGGWVGPRAVLDAVLKRKKSSVPARNRTPVI
jgi:hypothetical protein